METAVLLVDWKVEPLSPIFADELTVAPSDDAPLYWTNAEQANDDRKIENAEIKLFDAPADASKVDIGEDGELLDGLEHLEDIDELIKHEGELSWLVDSVDFPPSTFEPLLQDFVLNTPISAPLTPPQSPPYDERTLTTLAPLLTAAPVHPYAAKEQQLFHHGKHVVPELAAEYYAPPGTPQNIAQELEAVEELVRSRAQDILAQQPPSPSATTNSNSCSNDDYFSSSSEDPEWIPEPVEEYFGGEQRKAKRRYKPYNRISPEDKRSRKKEQNKNAATRYRMKKKAEVEVILNEEKSVQKENDELTVKIDDLQREIKYLKGLMREVFKAKGLIK